MTGHSGERVESDGRGVPSEPVHYVASLQRRSGAGSRNPSI